MPARESGIADLLLAKNKLGFLCLLLDERRGKTGREFLDFGVEGYFRTCLGATRHRHTPGDDFLQGIRTGVWVQAEFLTSCRGNHAHEISRLLIFNERLFLSEYTWATRGFRCVVLTTVPRFESIRKSRQHPRFEDAAGFFGIAPEGFGSNSLEFSSGAVPSRTAPAPVSRRPGNRSACTPPWPARGRR